METLSESSKLIYLVLMLLSLGCCKDQGLDQCDTCDSLPTSASIFADKWEWKYTIVKSNLPDPSPNPIDKIDTVTPLSSGSTASVLIDQSGHVTVEIDDERCCYCMNIVLNEHIADSIGSYCQDNLYFDYLTESQESYRSGAIIFCDSPDELLGAGYPHGSGLPPPSPIPIPDLLPGFEIKELVSYYSRVH